MNRTDIGGVIVDTWVYGHAKTKGSMKVRNPRTGVMTESVQGSGAWRRIMANAVRAWRAQRGLDEPYAGPVDVQLAFMLPAPPGTPELMMASGTWPRAGDVDKLTRNALDAIGCTSAADARAIVDDNLVTGLRVTKTGAFHLLPCVHIVVAVARTYGALAGHAAGRAAS